MDAQLSPDIAPLLSAASVEKEWLTQHIPHRIRAVLALSPLLGRVLDETGAYSELKSNAWRDCAAMGAWEGRLTATRWLIEFVGIEQDPATKLPKSQDLLRSDKKRNREPSKNRTGRFDVDIEDLPGGRYFPASERPEEAKFLSDTWKGCTQATSHPTVDSNHPSTDLPILEKAHIIIFGHLDAVLYNKAQTDCLRASLRF